MSVQHTQGTGDVPARTDGGPVDGVWLCSAKKPPLPDGQCHLLGLSSKEPGCDSPSWPPGQGITDLSDHVSPEFHLELQAPVTGPPTAPQALRSEATREICLKCNLTKSLLSLKTSPTPTASVGLATAGSVERQSCGVPDRSKTRQVQETPPAKYHSLRLIMHASFLKRASSLSRTPAT